MTQIETRSQLKVRVQFVDGSVRRLDEAFVEFLVGLTLTPIWAAEKIIKQILSHAGQVQIGAGRSDAGHGFPHKTVERARVFLIMV